MLIDANVLLYAVDESVPEHHRAKSWLISQLRGDRRVGIPWASLAAFVRLATNPRITRRTMTPEDAWARVTAWLDVPVVWVPGPTERHRHVFGRLVQTYRVTGNLVTDAHLAAIAIEHGLEVCSADSDFARFTEVRWRNPLTEAVVGIDLEQPVPEGDPVRPEPEPEEPD